MRCTHSTLVLWSTPADRGTESSGVGGAWPSYHIQEGEIGVGAGWELSTDPHQQQINPSLPMSR